MMASIRIIDLVTTDEDKKFEPAGRMAAAMIEVMQTNGDCLPQDLNEMGFSPAEVAQHWHMAKALAAVEIKLMGEHSIKPKSLLRRR